MMHQFFGSPAVAVATILVGTIACAIAVVTDLQARRVPNWLTFSTLALAVALALAGGFVHFIITLAIVIAMLALGVVLQGSGILGGGDVKLLIGIAALVGYPDCVALLIYTGIAGGLLALAVALIQGRLVRVCTGAVNVLVIAFLSRKIVVAREETNARHPLPYALAIAAGFAVLVLASTYVPAMRLPL